VERLNDQRDETKIKRSKIIYTLNVFRKGILDDVKLESNEKQKLISLADRELGINGLSYEDIDEYGRIYVKLTKSSFEWIKS